MWWTVHIEGGPRRVNHAAVAIGEKIFSFGGYCTGDNYQVRKPIDVFVLNTLNFRWTEIKKPEGEERNSWPFQRYGHTVIAYGDQIYLFGGRNDESACNILFKFDTNTYTWTQPQVSGELPGERDGHSACVINKCMYIFGGFEEVVERFGQDVYRLDLEDYTWRLLPVTGEPPIHRDFHSATAIGTNMYIFGGRSDLNGPGNHGPDYYSNKICYLDTTSLRWYTPSILPPQPAGRRSHSAINLDGKLLMFGGYNGRSKEHKNDLWLLDTETYQWTEIQPYGCGPNPRRRQALCRVDNKIFLFGGTSPYTGPELYFTPEQLSYLPTQHQGEENSTKLMDHNDLFVLDLAPSLKTLCFIQVKKHKLSVEGLPTTIMREMFYMSQSNGISKALRTVESKTG